jgi:hypothetical protein
MYGLLVLVVAIPLLTTHIPWLAKVVPDLPVPVSPEVNSAYEAVERVGSGKIAIISIIWSASTDAENRPQTEALARHLFMKGIPFMVVPFDQQGTTLAYDAINRIATEMHKVYGRDWVACGFQPGGYMVQIVQGMSNSLVGTLKSDRNGTSLDKIPMMQGKESDSVGLIVEITPSATVPVWIAYMAQPNRIPIIYCPTAVMVPEGHNYLDAHQVVGMLPGLIGAAQYEEKLGVHGFGLRAASALSTSHILIIVLIVLGNAGYFLSRRRNAGT